MSDQTAGLGVEPADDGTLDELDALVVVDADGREGLAVVYVTDEDGQMERRMTFVAPAGSPILDILGDYADELTPPPGGRFEWRRFTVLA